MFQVRAHSGSVGSVGEGQLFGSGAPYVFAEPPWVWVGIAPVQFGQPL